MYYISLRGVIEKLADAILLLYVLLSLLNIELLQ